MYLKTLPFFLFTLLFFSLNQSYAQDTEQRTSIYFETASAEMDETAMTEATKLVEWMADLGDYFITVKAHTDSRGSTQYNENLARERAESVAAFLKQNGIAVDNLKVSSYGESHAGQDVDSEESLAKNRRVDVLVNGFHWTGLSQLQDSLQANTVQYFQINTMEDEVIDGRNGGRFFIPAGSFMNENGEVIEGDISIALTECYDFGSMMQLGLNTASAGAILETGGMLRMEASLDDAPLTLVEGRSITASVPTPEFQRDMSLFLGVEHDEEGVDWANTEQQMEKSPFPLLRFANGPARPSKISFLTDWDVVINIEEKPQAPAPFNARRNYRPRTPNPDRIQYRPKGLQKIFMSKEKIEARRQEMIAEKNASFEENLQRYEEKEVIAEAARTRHSERLVQYAQDTILWHVKRDSLIEEYMKTEEYIAKQEEANNIHRARLRKYSRDSTAYQNYRRQKTARYEAAFERYGVTSKQAVDRYFFNMNQLGWANIDRFMKENVERTTLAVNDASQTSEEASVFFVVPDRNIILRMPANNVVAQQYFLNTVPQGERAKIIAFKVADNKALLAQQELVLGPNMELELDFQPGRLKDIRLALEGVN